MLEKMSLITDRTQPADKWFEGNRKRRRPHKATPPKDNPAETSTSDSASSPERQSGSSLDITI